jgi:CRP-like cAMP-binding protein/Zn-dependent protease
MGSLKKSDLQACRKILEQHPLLGQLSKSLMDQLMSEFTLVYCKAGEMLFKEGDPLDSIFFIKSGKAEVSKEVTFDKKYQKVPIATLNAYEAIGLDAQGGFFSKTGKRSASIIAQTDLTLFRLEKKALNHFLKEHLPFSQLFQESDLLMKVDFIKQVAPFAELSTQQLYSFAERVKERFISKGDILFKEGESGEECYLLCKGSIQIYTKKSGEEKNIATLEPTDILGETALLMESPRNASAKALEDCQLLLISKTLLFEILGQETSAEDMLMHIVSLRSRPTRAENIEEYHSKNREGEEVVTLRDPNHWRYFQLTKEGWFIWQQLDGKKSVKELTVVLFKAFGIFNPNLVGHLIKNLEMSGFIFSHEGEKSRLQKSEDTSAFFKFFIKIRQVMEYRVALHHVDEWISKTYLRGVRFLFTWWMQVIFLMLGFVGLGLFGFYFGRSVPLLQQVGHSKWWLLLASIPAIMVIAVLHELSHAYATKFFGRRVRGFGVGWLWIGPIAFCDTSDMWLSSAKKRVIVDLAGIYFHFILAGTLAIFFLLIPNPYLSLFCWYLALLNYFMIFGNLSPVIELDGYYALMDSLDHPNLKQDAVKWVVAWPSAFSQLKQHKAEMIYWLSCFVYLILELIFPFIVFHYLLKGFFGVINPLWSLGIALLVVISSSLGILGEIKKNQSLISK